MVHTMTINARVGQWWGRAVFLNLAVIVYIGGSSLLVYAMPHSLLAFLLFLGSILALYYLRIAQRAKLAYAAITLARNAREVRASMYFFPRSTCSGVKLNAFRRSKLCVSLSCQ